jgi:hypothetical protein
MSQLPPEIQALTSDARFARFLKVDLHVHTPATPWCWNQHNGDGPAAGKLNAAAVAAAIVATDVDVVAITDHDTVAWTDEVIREVRKHAKKAGRRITVLPGVEVTTYDGVHLLAIFGQETPVVDIAKMLMAFDLKGNGVKSERASSNWPLAKVAARIEEVGGMVVAPHAGNPSLGIWGGDKSEHKGKRTDWMREGVARILACGPDQAKGLATAIRNAGIDRRFAFIRHSDAHTFAAIGEQATYIKLAEPTIEGLRQVIHEPELRVSFVRPPAPTHPRIIGMEIDGGYFTKERLVFSEHLNALVGGNYSGKSAVVDALRFVFDDQCFGDPTERGRLLDRIGGIMGGGTIRVWLLGIDGVHYRVERRALIMKEKRAQGDRLSCSVDAVVTKLSGKVELPVNSLPRDILPIDFYGQGSVGQVAKYHEKHRELIDAMAGTTLKAKALDPAGDNNHASIVKLIHNATAIATTKVALEKLNAELESLDSLREQLKKLESQAQSQLLKDWSKWQDGQQEVDSVREYLESIEMPPDVDAIVGGALGESPELGEVADAVAVAMLPLREALKKLDASATRGARLFANALAADVKGCQAALAKWDKVFAQKREAVTAKLRALKLSSEEALLKRIGELKKQIAAVEKRRTEIGKLQAQLARLEQERIQELANLANAWAEVRARRKRLVENLNAITGVEIRIAYTAASERSRLATRLDALIRDHGSKDAMVQRRDREVNHLVARYDAGPLVDAIRHDDPQELVTESTITSNTAQFLCGLPLEETLSLQLCVADDHVELTYRRPGEEEYTGLKDLSPGERAVVLLTVAFAGGEGPLVIDQPEDELGQALVTADIVETIRRRKANRQFVVVTHNANIPVLGDAEGVFAMRNEFDGVTRKRRCKVQDAGAIECEPIKTALLGLEGGRDSFLKRQERYHITM